MNPVEQAAMEKRILGQSICVVLEAEIKKLEFKDTVVAPDWDSAQFSIKQDPALGSDSLEALWLGKNGTRRGSVVLHSDGTFFAEYDIILPHPKKSKWFVEAVTAWGRDGVIKSEARLLPMPE